MKVETDIIGNISASPLGQAWEICDNVCRGLQKYMLSGCELIDTVNIVYVIWV